MVIAFRYFHTVLEDAMLHSSTIVNVYSRFQRLIGFLAALFLFLGCGQCASNNRSSGLGFTAVSLPLPSGYTLFQTTDSNMEGLSGLTVSPSSTLWAIPEQKRFLVPIVKEGETLRLREKPIPIIGIDEDLDTESIAALSDTEFVVGTEGHGKRATDKLFWLKRDRTKARVVKVVSVEYRLWGIKAENNKGLEGLCYANGQLVIAGEPVFVVQGRRYAPIVRYEIATGTFYPAQLALTTTSGKISAVFCSMTQMNSLDVFAIERHYEIARVLGFKLPIASTKENDQPVTILPEVKLDLANVIHPLPNFEGIARMDSDLFLLTDNNHSGVVGPTYLLRVSSAPRQ
jgi:hypothetical protein